MIISPSSTYTPSLYPTIFVLELIERTKRCAILWDKVGINIYQTSWTANNKTYITSVSQLQYTCQLSVSSNNRNIYNLDGANIPEVVDLWLILGDMFDQNDLPLIPLQNQASCSNVIIAHGGVIAGGEADVEVV